MVLLNYWVTIKLDSGKTRLVLTSFRDSAWCGGWFFFWLPVLGLVMYSTLGATLLVALGLAVIQSVYLDVG